MICNNLKLLVKECCGKLVEVISEIWNWKECCGKLVEVISENFGMRKNIFLICLFWYLAYIKVF